MSERKVTILGFGETAHNVDLVQACAGREVWCLNNGWAIFPWGTDPATGKPGLKPERWFALHTWEAIERTYTDKMGHDPWTMLDLMNCPVYMQSANRARIRHAVCYPFEQVFKFHGTAFALGSPSYMLALALFEGVKDIESWGIDMLDDQHLQQRTSWAAWIMRAQQMGCRIGGSALLYQQEPDLDGGLVGLRDQIRKLTGLEG